jgi:hypothetical protein
VGVAKAVRESTADGPVVSATTLMTFVFDSSAIALKARTPNVYVVPLVNPDTVEAKVLASPDVNETVAVGEP